MYQVPVAEFDLDEIEHIARSIRASDIVALCVAYRALAATVDNTTSLVGCSACGRGYPARYLVTGLCAECAAAELARLRAATPGARGVGSACRLPRLAA